MEPGKPKRQDYHYKRNGVCTVFMAFESLMGCRFVQVREHRAGKDYALFMQWVNAQYPEAEVIVVIQDNLSTHNPGSFYQAFTPDDAFALAQRFGMHYTPTTASWLNMVESELSVLSKQFLDWRIGAMDTLEREVLAWTDERNTKQASFDGQRYDIAPSSHRS
jgi:DDE superfamily endonuclease